MRSERISPTLILALALVFGIWGNTVLRPLPLGLNIFLWFAPIIMVFYGYTTIRTEEIKRGTAILLSVALIFSLVPAFRASGLLIILSILTTLFALVMASLSHAGFTLGRTSTSQILYSLLLNPLESAFAWFQWIPMESIPASVVTNKRKHRAFGIARGLLLSLPFALIFISLFASADQQFGVFVYSFEDIHLERAVPHIFFSALYTWAALTLLVLFYFADKLPNPTSRASEHPNSWAMELIVILSVINAIFIVYGYFQLGYLFGGVEHIMRTPNLTVAQYARRGFFESATACVLVLIIVQSFRERLRSSENSFRRTYKYLAITLIALGMIVIASAFQRIMIYTDTFGLTLDRLYIYVALVWMLLCFIWFVATVVLPWHDRFILGAIGLAFACFGILIAINPDVTVAKANVARFERIGEFDLSYALRLSDDAYPVLAGVVPNLNSEQQQRFREHVANRQSRIGRVSFTNWNLARSRLMRDFEYY